MSRPTGPFGQPSNLAVSGLVSFDPSMHGTPSGSTLGDDLSYAELSQETAQKIASLQAKLNQKLGPEFLSQRPGPGGGPKLTYIEGWKVINVANEVFGFNGWSSSIVNLTTDFMDYNEQSQRYNIGVTAIVRVTLRDGVFHEDIGYGTIDNARGKGAALDKCKKEAVTDALKRALRAFGNLLGNCLYDKSYVSEVVKIKVPQQKFDKNELHRRPEFDQRSASAAPAAPAVKTESVAAPALVPAPRPQVQPQPKPANQTPNPKSGPSYPTGMGPPGGGTGLNTPITTPQQQSRVSSRPPPPPPAAPPQPAPAAAAPPPPVAPQQPKPINDPSPGSDEFAFYSDDDAILANVDAEVDMGRPIGGENHFEEQENLDTSMTDGSAGSSVNWAMPPPPPPRGGFMPGGSSSSAGSSSAAGIGTGNPRGGFISGASSSGNAQPGHSRSGGFMSGASSSSTANLHRTSTGGANTPTPSTRRSGGGFHFPAGVTHEQLQRTPLATLPISNPHPHNSSSSLTSSSAGYADGVGVGMKRKADSVVDSGGGGGRRMGPGMGLLHSNPALNPQGRPQNQNQNHFGGGNGAFGDDAKRVKR